MVAHSVTFQGADDQPVGKIPGGLLFMFAGVCSTVIIITQNKSTQQNPASERKVILITDKSTQQKSDFNHKNESTQQDSRPTGWLNKITYVHVDYGKFTVKRRKNK